MPPITISIRFAMPLAAPALIDRQLSAYRIHDANYFTERKLVYG